jgi:hypothetical protein
MEELHPNPLGGCQEEEISWLWLSGLENRVFQRASFWRTSSMELFFQTSKNSNFEFRKNSKKIT